MSAPMGAALNERTFKIDYTCPKCGHQWQDTHSSACDAECPECHTSDIEAADWEEISDYDAADVSELILAARAVIAKWAKGDLAEAVRKLDAAQQQFGEF